MKPPISYYGGKQRMSSKIIPLIPKHTVYVEPFAGGAAVFFAKPWPDVSNNNHYREVLNDHDGRLINFYKVLRDPVDGPELVRRLQLTLYSKQEHKDAKQNLDGCADRIEWARAYYIQANMSFANTLCRGWGASVFGENSAATWANGIARLPEYLERMASVHIECDDAIKVIERWDSPQTFFYCDPPYPGTDLGHYKGYTHDDFARLVSALDNAQGSFLLSNYAQDGVPDSWERFEFSATASSSGKGKAGKNRDKTRAATAEKLGDRKRTEIVWRRFAKTAPRVEIQKLYDAGKFDCFSGEQMALALP